MGLGGIFFRARHLEKMSEWYRKHLDLKITQNTALFTWRSRKAPKKLGHAVRALFPSDTSYFRDARKQFMINYGVRDLKGIVDKLRKEGVKVARKVEDSQYGKFAWVRDPEGNWLEL